MCNNFQKYSWEQKNYCTLMSYHPSITSANTKEVIFIILFQSPLQKHKKVNLLLSIELMDLMTVGLMLQNLKESKQGRKIFNDELMNLKSRTFIRPDLGSLYPQDISHSNLELREVILYKSKQSNQNQLICALEKISLETRQYGYQRTPLDSHFQDLTF